MPTGTVGARHELLVACDLMAHGYSVFRALSPACPCDLAVLHGTTLLRIEVRTGVRKVGGGFGYSTPGKDAGRQDHYAIVLRGPEEIRYFPPLPPP